MITSFKKPNKELKAIITNDLPTACFMGMFVKIINAGIIKNPPPAPRKPVTKPTKKPINANL